MVCQRPNPQARLRLFCFPYAGGAASIFYTWPDDLPKDVEVCPIQLPGRQDRIRETPFTHVTPLVQAIAPAIRPYLDKPYAFFGHSLGTLISFELARLLAAQNDPGPVRLLVSGHRAPQAPDPNPPIHHLPDAEFIEELERLNGTPEMVLENPELLQLFLPLLRADFTAAETYTYTAGAPLDCHISAFGGLQDDKVSRDGLAAWQEQTRRTFTLRMFPGDHFFLHSARALLLQALSRDLLQDLDQTAGGG
jgi:medium-chain acyl-[acyl-carrier-protein] hydrolase